VSGTVVNGVIVLEGNTQLPEGARVWVELDEDEDIGPPPEPYDREKELAILREAIVDPDPGMTLDECMEALARKHNLPSPSAD
jgi:hypothetical protein